MRVALGRRPQRRAAEQPGWQGVESYMPFPAGGWDTETPAIELPATLARVFDNWMPQGVQGYLRKGYSDHVTGLGSTVETLLSYNAGSSSTLFGAAGANIYNVTSAGAVGAAVVTSLTSARFSYVNFTTSGGTFLWICNGADDPRHWNGSAWAVPSLSITTYTDNNISYVLGFKERLFFIFKNTLTFGYLPVQSVAGTVSNFPMGAVFNNGGRLVALGALSRDGGDGMDDFFVALTSEGEIAVYQGSNPGDAAAWALVGVYDVGEPVGDRPMVKIGDDLAIITRLGVVSVGHVISGVGENDALSHLLNAPIAGSFRDAVRLGASYSGWEGLQVPTQNLLLINGPKSGSTAYQYVRNRVTGGWGRFTDWDFATFEVFGGALYAGGYDGTVYLCFDGEDDDGDDITGRLATGWSTLGSPQLKTLQEVRPILTTATTGVVRIVGRTDFRDRPALGAWPSSTITNAGVWDVTSWDECLWGGEDATTRQWRAISGEGHAVSLVMECRAQSQFAINGFNLRYQPGGQV